MFARRRPAAGAGAAGSGGARCRAVSLAGRFAVIGVIFAIGIAPVLANMLPDLRAEGDFFTVGRRLRRRLLRRPGRLPRPDAAAPGARRHHPGLVATTPRRSPTAVLRGRQGPAHLRRLRGAGAGACRAAGAAAGRPDALALGRLRGRLLPADARPEPAHRGHDTGIPLPFRLMELLPFFKGNRYPSRYSVMLLAEPGAAGRGRRRIAACGGSGSPLEARLAAAGAVKRRLNGTSSGVSSACSPCAACSWR